MPQQFSRRTVLAGGAGAFGLAAAALRTGVANAAPVQRRGPIVISDGRARASLVLPAEPHPDERQAADELISHLSDMAGVEVRAGTAPVPGLLPVYVGAACPDLRLDDVDDPDGTGHSFRIQVTHNRIQLAGTGSAGTLFAAYELLEQLGVRWLMPGPHGTVLPRVSNVIAPEQDLIGVPTFGSRQLHFVDNYLGTMPPGVDRNEGADWSRRRRLRGESWDAHGIDLQPPASKTAEPELYIHENGVPTNQLDVTNPEVLRRATAYARTQLAANPELRVLRMGPADGHGFGVTDWDAGNWDTLAGLPSVTDRYIRFFNLVLEDLQRDHPDVGIAFFCYDNYMLPPVRVVPNRKIIPALAPINVDRLHTAAEPSGQERRYYLRLADRWRTMVDGWSYRGYLFNLADPGLPFVPIAPARDEIPLYVRHKSRYGCRMEVSASWGYDAPAFYLATKLMWDATADPAAVLAEFCAAAYGPAAAPMADYFGKIADTVSRAPIMTGRWLAHVRIFTATDFEKLDQLLADAERRADDTGDPGIVDRVAVARIAFQFGWSIWDALRSWHEGSFTQAAASLTRAESDFAVAVSHQPVALYPQRRNFMNLIAPPIRAAAERTAGDNEIVWSLPDELSAILDDTDDGLADELYAADVPDAGWRPLATRSRSASDQGLSYFRGAYWYRTSLPISAAWAERRLSLWLGSVDESVRAWVNGTELPLIAGSKSFQPWEFDLRGKLRFDGTDRLVMRVVNRNLNELGTGGLVGPAFVWAGEAITPLSAPPPVVRGPGRRDLGQVPQPVVVSTAGWHQQLPAQWRAKIDPVGDCAELGLWERQIPTANQWLELATDRSIAEQGLAYYSGGLVYRFDGQLPSQARSGRLMVPSRARLVSAWLDDKPLRAVGWSDDVHSYALPSIPNRSVTLVIAIRDSPGAGRGGLHGRVTVTDPG
ncbi:hypothetical protein HDA40_000730 [Hamadaea flava]|uniref:DUF4838 domain-containing protein n=1 Tax=Hamadaea flava TaxID=1742688 RepID=A0ABV8LX27_9ACTN|nr:DUF4838 domain-containing protein [Hamadaea flava]MCP2322223.1 hypothetical protein [Hamadaea flava]